VRFARSSFYKTSAVQQRKQCQDEKTIAQVQRIRYDLPRIGGKKLHYLLQQTMQDYSLGRDRLFRLLRAERLLILRRRNYAVTTDSRHQLPIYENKLVGLAIEHPNQAWVSDITYVRTKQGFAYVSFVTDLYSRKIVGYHANHSLELAGCVRAIKMALKQGVPAIHHSDRGSQYCSPHYTQFLTEKGTVISMAEKGNCYQNAVAERINGIMKGEFKLNATFASVEAVQKAVAQAVENYNNKRPHWMLKLKVPAEIYAAAS
jgi:transposase InsO family protein